LRKIFDFSDLCKVKNKTAFVFKLDLGKNKNTIENRFSGLAFTRAVVRSGF
jgi:hypothetical protein